MLSLYIFSVMLDKKIATSNMTTILGLNDQLANTQTEILISIDDFVQHINLKLEMIKTVEFSSLSSIKLINPENLTVSIDHIYPHLSHSSIPIPGKEKIFNDATPSELRDLFRSTLVMNIDASYKIDAFDQDVTTPCQHVHMNSQYDFTKRSSVYYTINLSHSTCRVDRNIYYLMQDPTFVISVLILALSLIQLIAILRKINLSFKAVFYLRQKLITTGNLLEWKRFTVKDKLKLFNGWHFLFLINCIVQIFCKLYFDVICLHISVLLYTSV